MSGDLAITNLNFRTSVDELCHVFSKFGELQMCNLILNDRSESKGYAFLSFKRRRDAAAALEELNGFRMYGRPIKIGWVTNTPSNSTPKFGGNPTPKYGSNSNPRYNSNYNPNISSNFDLGYDPNY